ncbi:MAG: TonB-dependent receptor, partial [Cyanobacteria bacterium P01_G01_bin.38]
MKTQIRLLGFSVLASMMVGKACPVLAQVSVEAQSLDSLGAGILSAEILSAEVTKPESLRVNQIVQVGAAVITDVQISETAEGLSIVLVSDQPLSTSDSQVSGNALITEIPGATLALTDATVAEQFSPAEGIALVQVSSSPDGGVEVAITGTDAPPVAQVGVEAGNLTLSVVPGVATAEAADPDSIQLVVTATRTEEDILDVPRSVRVIDREQIEQQLELTNNLPDILGELVPGLSPPPVQTTTRGFTLRGRNALILIDGVPQNPNGPIGFELNTIAPDSIERIEVVPGASAIYGDGATGGTINIITRAPLEEGVVYNADIGTRVGLTSVEEDSFSYEFGFGVAAADERADGRLSLTYDINNARFDADGDRIPPETGISDTNRLGLLAKLGYDLDDDQRLAFTYSFYEDALDSVFATDTSIFTIPGTQTARAIRTGSIDYEEPPQAINHVLNLTYRHADLLGSQLDAQLYYTDLEVTQTFGDLRLGGFPDFFPDIFQNQNNYSELGARVQVDTPLGNSASLLWGADYAQEENENAALFLDAEAFDANRELNVTDEFSLFPKYEIDSLGLFAQARWDITEQWQISGGLRYDSFDFSVDDYQLAFQFPREREGGSGSADDVSFNAGLLYRPVPEIGLFANFSQGFSIPNLGLAFSSAVPTFDIDDNLALEPQKVDNFEVGVRAEFDQVQASIAGFYSESDLGSAFAFNQETLSSELVRAPQRNYGVEATLDWQPSNTWQLGGYFSWSEGENDVDDDGDFLALGSLNVPPYKLGLYVENETTPGWTNRLQMLLVGDRDRA